MMWMFVLLCTSSSLTLQWWGLHSFCLHIAVRDCHKIWSDINRSSHRPRDRHRCRIATASRVRSCRWWSGFSAGKQSAVRQLTQGDRVSVTVQSTPESHPGVHNICCQAEFSSKIRRDFRFQSKKYLNSVAPNSLHLFNLLHSNSLYLFIYLFH